MTKAHLENRFYAGVQIDAETLREALRINSYVLSYDVNKELLTLTVGYGQEILRVTCPPESANKFAKDFGFPDSNNPTRSQWVINFPSIVLYSDGSKNVKVLEKMLNESRLPYTIEKSPNPALFIESKRHAFPENTLADLKQKIKRVEINNSHLLAIWRR